MRPGFKKIRTTRREFLTPREVRMEYRNLDPDLVQAADRARHYADLAERWREFAADAPDEIIRANMLAVAARYERLRLRVLREYNRKKNSERPEQRTEPPVLPSSE
jgi:hypothetical protein